MDLAHERAIGTWRSPPATSSEVPAAALLLIDEDLVDDLGRREIEDRRADRVTLVVRWKDDRDAAAAPRHASETTSRAAPRQRSRATKRCSTRSSPASAAGARSSSARRSWSAWACGTRRRGRRSRALRAAGIEVLTRRAGGGAVLVDAAACSAARSACRCPTRGSAPT